MTLAMKNWVRAKVTRANASQRALALLAFAVGCSVYDEPRDQAGGGGAGGMSSAGKGGGSAGKGSAGSSGTGTSGGGNATTGGQANAGETSAGGADAIEPSCYDAQLNGDEEKVDCGGSCLPCAETPCSDIVIPPAVDEVLAKDALVGWYRFGDAESLGSDLSPAQNDALSYEVVSQGSDPKHGCVGVFAGNAKMTLPPSTTTNLTFSLWLRTDTLGLGEATDQWFDGSSLLDGEAPGVVEDLGLGLLGNRAAFGVGKPDQTLRAGPALDDNVWHQVVVTRDDTTGEMALFVDGDEHGRTTAATGARSSVKGFVIGRNQLKAQVADVRIYNRVFSKAEVVQLYQGK